MNINWEVNVSLSRCPEIMYAHEANSTKRIGSTILEICSIWSITSEYRSLDQSLALGTAWALLRCKFLAVATIILQILNSLKRTFVHNTSASFPFRDST